MSLCISVCILIWTQDILASVHMHKSVSPHTHSDTDILGYVYVLWCVYPHSHSDTDMLAYFFFYRGITEC